MSSWAYGQTSNANCRAAMLAGHMMPRANPPSQALPPIVHLFDVADNGRSPSPPISLMDTTEEAHSVYSIPTPSPSPVLSPITATGLKRVSEEATLTPDARSQGNKRQKTQMESNEVLAQRLELSSRVETFLDRARSSVEVPASPRQTLSDGLTGKQRHNLAQTELRLLKAIQKRTIQRMMFSLGWRGSRVQSKKNAMTSGLIYEETDLMQGVMNLLSMFTFMADVFFEEDKLDELMAMASQFAVDEVEVEDGGKAARVRVMLEAGEPFQLHDMRSESYMRHVVHDLMPLSTKSGKACLQNYLNRKFGRKTAKL